MLRFLKIVLFVMIARSAETQPQGFHEHTNFNDGRRLACGPSQRCVPYSECHNAQRAVLAVCRYDVQGHWVCCDVEAYQQTSSYSQLVANLWDLLNRLSPILPSSPSSQNHPGLYRATTKTFIFAKDHVKEFSPPVTLPHVHHETSTQPSVVPGRNVDDVKCGKPGPSFFVTNGRETQFGELPWMAVLQYSIYDVARRKELGQRWVCGGSLINEQFVLTAAHCLDETSLGDVATSVGTVYRPKKYPATNEERYEACFWRMTKINFSLLVRLGEHRFFSNPDCFYPSAGHEAVCSTTHDYRIYKKNVIIHPDFNKRQRNSDDLALIKLDRRAAISPHIQPICLPPKTFNLDSLLRSGRQPYVAGWGVFNVSFGVSSEVLLKAPISPFDRDKCIAYYRKSSISVLPEQLCFGGEQGVDSCNGDSGGPLFVSRSSTFPEFVQIGIVSQGHVYCGLNGVPALYTKVFSYIDWIQAQISNENSTPQMALPAENRRRLF